MENRELVPRNPDTPQGGVIKDDDRKGTYPNISFDFLGYTFKTRDVKNKYEKYFSNFLPAIADKAKNRLEKK